MLADGPILGVIHLLPLPGSPRFAGDLRAVVRRAVSDAKAYEGGGAHGVIVENYGDAPFFKEALPPETVAALALCAAAVRDAVRVPLGVNALRNDARAALGVAAAAGARFVRINVHAGVVATDQGILEGRAAETLRARALFAPSVRIAADACVKHGRPIHPESVVRAAQDLVGRAGADAVIVSGEATGAPASLEELRAVREALPRAVLAVGSGVTVESAPRLLRYADFLVVGTALKRGGKVEAPVDPKRVRAMVRRATRRALRSR
jgi:membrane complex biogenesis BtpA family protein